MQGSGPVVVDLDRETVKRGMQDGSILLVDVREPHEWEIVHLEQARLIPLATLPAHLHEYDRNDSIVVHCRSGARSAQATQLLKDAGFHNVQNLEGGILRWANDVDPSLPTY